MTILQRNLGFDNLIKDVRERGVAFVPEVLTPEFLAQLQVDIATLEMTEEKMDEDFLKLKFEFAKLHYPFEGHEALSNLGLHLAWQARTHRGMVESLSNWHPNEVAIQRYRDGSDDIGAHKDYKRDRYLIAIVTAEGYGRFEVLTDDGEGVKYAFETGPGSLTLLWASELTKGDGDRRPLHRALAPKYGSRTSVTYRLVLDA
jgi:hypothetical protein